MPAAATHADALRFYLTGAASVGAAQSDPDASLGAYRGDTELTMLDYQITSAITGVVIEQVSGENGTGTGSLDAPTSSSLRWQPPGGSYGAEVSIANGETKLLEGSDTDKWIRVSRTQSTNLSGTASVELSREYNNAIGFDNVSDTEASNGDDEVRALCAYVAASAAISSLQVWLAELGTQATTDDGQLSSSGSGTIGTSTDSFADWPDTGFARIEDSGGSLREIVYYSERTDSALTIPGSDARGLLGTSAAAGASDDEAHAVPGLRIAQEFGDVGSASFTGSGTDDATFSGSYKGQTDRTYRVEIDDASSSPETFRWSRDGGSTWEATGVAITGSAQTLDQGVEVTFGSTTGHTAGDYWDSSCVAKAAEPADEDTIPSGLSWNTEIAQSGGVQVGGLESDEQVFLWLRRATVTGQVADASLLNQINIYYES